MSTAAIPMPVAAPALAAAVLDDRQIWEAFSVPDAHAPGVPEGERWVSHVAVEGMHCASCGFTVEKALAGVRGVVSVQVNSASRVARVVWSAALTQPSAWFAAARGAGYTMVPVSGLQDSLARASEGRRLLWRWLVAGFCMMQVMMYAVPAYVAAPGEMTPDMVQLLRWASWVLTLPVMLFSASPFFASAWRDLRQRQLGMDVPVALGILIAFLASTAATFQPEGVWGEEVWFDSVTMFVFFLLSGRLLEQRLRHRTAGALEALARRLPDSVERQCHDGRFERVALHRLVLNDVVRVLPGEAFPADGTLLQGRTRVDEALLTGESRPLRRDVGDAVIAGSHNLSAVVQVRVERLGAATRYAGIVALVQAAAAQKPAMAQLADRVAKPFLLAVMLASAAAAAWWWPQSPAHAIGVAIAVLIVTCPCALSLATPTATLAAAGAMARAGVLVRRLQALATMTAVDTVIFDKTGTLTQDTMTVKVRVTRQGVLPEEALQWAAALARHSIHPVSRAVAAAAHGEALVVTQVSEEAGQGLRGVLMQQGHSSELRLGQAAFCGVNDPLEPGVDSQVFLADGHGWVATLVLEESLRPDAVEAVRALEGAGLQVHVVSGDRSSAVQRLAERIGVASYRAGQSPADKLALLIQLQRSGRRVAMVGDGINDAPVLARADVSFTLGQAAPLAQSRADVVVLGGQLMAVVSVLERAVRTRRIVAQNLVWAAGYNAICVPLAVVGWMPAWLAGIGMALSSLVVVVNASRLAARVTL